MDARPTRLLRLPAVRDRVALSRSSIYAMVNHGEFPAPVQLSPRCVAWRESDIDDFIASRMCARDPTGAATQLPVAEG